MRLRRDEIVPFEEGQTTERGERVYSTLRITCRPCFGHPVTRTIQPDTGLGMTEEFIEDTIQGALQALDKDYPHDLFHVERLKPNDIELRYAGTKGVVN